MVERERIEFVQALRGIAALAVVMFHARIWIDGPAYLDAGDRLFANGAAGVDLFFVISGFIMVHTTIGRPGGPRAALRFFAKRFARVWPVYMILTLAYVVAEGSVARWTANPHALLVFSKSMVFYPQGGGPPFFSWTPNGVGWTLNYEMWFYVLFAIAIAVGRWRWQVLAALFACFLVVVPLIACGHFDWDAYYPYPLWPRILSLGACSLVWEFLAGALICLVVRSRFRVHNREVLGAFAILAVTYVVCQQLSNDHNRHGMTGWGPGMIVMVLALALWNRESPIRVPRWLQRLGELSFSLYLVHRVVQLGLARLIPEGHSTLAGGFSYVLVTTMLSLVLAHFSWRYLEQGVAERMRVWLLRRIG